MPRRITDIKNGADDETDGLGNAPWWVKSFIRVGAPTAFASVLLWYLMTNVTQEQAAILTTTRQILTITATITENQRLILQNQGEIIQLLMNSESNSNRLTNVLAAYCFNNADTAAERERCTTGAYK